LTECSFLPSGNVSAFPPPWLRKTWSFKVGVCHTENDYCAPRSSGLSWKWWTWDNERRKVLWFRQKDTWWGTYRQPLRASYLGKETACLPCCRFYFLLLH
jgi:hypothetical protein